MSFINNIFRKNFFHVVKSKDNNIISEENVDDSSLNQLKNINKKVKKKLKNC